MTNDINILYAQNNLAQALERYARITLYGLHYNTDFISLYARHLAIKALLIDENIDILTETQYNCLIKVAGKGKINTATKGGCGCS